MSGVESAILDNDLVGSADSQPGDALLLFEPHEGQWAFIESRATQKVVEGGNRTGKTEIVICEAVSYALGYRPWLPIDHPLHKTRFEPPIKIRIAAEDKVKGIGQDVIPKLLKFLPKYYYDPENGVGSRHKDQNGVEQIITLSNGSTFEFLSYEMDVASAEGWSGHLVIGNEPMPRALYVALFRGLVDHMGEIWFAMTPLLEPWIDRELFGRADTVSSFNRDRGSNKIAIERVENKKDVPSGIEAFRWDISVNAGKGITWEAIDRYSASLTERERECRLHGKPMHFQGLVFDEFSRPVHVVEGELDKTQPYTFYESYDPHARTPHAVGFYAVGQDNIPIKYDEISVAQQPNGACTAPELASMVLARRKGEPVFMVGDPSAFIDAHGMSSFATRLSEASAGRIQLEKGSKDLDGGILAIKEAMRVKNGYPGYRILKKCGQTIWEYENLVYQEYKGLLADRKTENNKPVDKDDHHIECDRRAFMGGMIWRENFACLNGAPWYESADSSDSTSGRTGDKKTGY